MIKALKGEEKKSDTTHPSKREESQELVENITADKIKRTISRRQTATQEQQEKHYHTKINVSSPNYIVPKRTEYLCTGVFV